MKTLPNTPTFTTSILKANEVYEFASHLLPCDIAIAKGRDFNTALVRGVRFAGDPTATDIEISNLARDLGIGGKIAKSTSVLSAELAKRNCTTATLTPFDLQQILGKTDGNSGEYTAMAIGFFSAASIIASKVANGTAADHTYLYDRFIKSEIKTGFVNGQTIFAVCSFPDVYCNGSGVHIQIAGEIKNAGFELLHLNEEQQAKWGFEWGITAEQMRAFTSMAPSHYISEFEICGQTHGIPLFDKTALNQIKTLNAFVQYVAKWESRNHDAFEAVESAGAEPLESPEFAEATEQAPEVETAATEESAPLVAYFDDLLSEPTETTEQDNGPELNNESALQDYFKGMLADDTISGPYESTGAVLAPAGSAALTEPAIAPILFPETAIAVNKEAPNIFRAVNAGLCSIAPKFSTDEPEPEALEATPLEAAGNGPLAPERGQIEHLSFEYFGHRYQLDYSNEGWRWTFDDYKDQCGRGFCFKADGMTLAKMLKSGLLGTDARYLGELVAYVENEHQINLGQFACKDLEEATYGYICGRGFSFGAEGLPAAKLLGVKIYLPVYKSNGRINLESRFEQADWQIDIAAYSVPLLCSAGCSKANAAEFIKGWTNAILWRAEEELDRAQTSATAYDDDYTTDAGDFNDIPF